MSAEEALRRALKQAEDAAERAALVALNQIGAAVANNARDLAPVETGVLRDSITHEVGRDERGPYVNVVAGESYAAFVEFGSQRQEPEPYLRPAVDRERPKIGAKMRAEIAKAQREALGSLPSEVEL